MATVLTSDQRYIALDDAQYETGEGPCLEALTRLDPIYLKDAGQARDLWPHFAQTAQHLGVRSTLSLHLPVGEGRLAASMNLYATQTLDLGDDQIAAAATIGEPVAEALKVAEAYRVAVRLAENLAQAMRSRAVIEQAKGMLMAERQITAATRSPSSPASASAPTASSATSHTNSSNAEAATPPPPLTRRDRQQGAAPPHC
jgi:GAF domain-containing protein